MRSHGGAASSASTTVEADGLPDMGPGDPEAIARLVCLRMLEQRARTRAELAAALRRKGVPDPAAEAVLTRFVEVGLIDDAALAEGYARAQHVERGLAGRAVAVKLRRRGVAEPLVRAAIDQIDDDSEQAAADQLARRKLRSLGGLPTTTQARRLISLLARRGYSGGLAYSVVRNLLTEQGEQLDVDAELRD